MTLIRSDQIRASLISALKANSNVITLLDDSNEVREFDWKGADFTYPNLRVQIRENLPDLSLACGQTMLASIYAFSEENSSTQAETITGIIMDEWHGKSVSSDGLFFVQMKIEPIPAIAESEITWRSELRVRSIVTNLT